jgi:methylmalonyl-CoA mutase N-terminal domain/subunit
MKDDTSEKRFRSGSGIEVDAVYEATAGEAEGLGRPGQFPFTRGIYPNMYRGRLWTMRQYAGFGTADETNQRYHYLLSQGTTGLSVAFDLPTQMGYDSDHPIVRGEVGRVGVAIDTIEDMRTLFHGIALDQVSTSMTINSTAAILFALYLSVGDEQGVGRNALSGTVQNDVLKEYVARGTYIYPVGPSLRLATDLVAFCAREVPRWNAISISGYHIREAGSTAPQEVAFTLANGLAYVERVLVAGVPLEDFAPRLSFFFAAHNDLLEEVAKFRAARRLWARLMKERFGASDRSCLLRFHTQTGGSTLTAQQPLNNVVRVTVQALAAAFGGTQSLHTNGFDEGLALPTSGAAKLALRTQQILAHESGITNTVDPLAGSYYVEALTSQIEDAARAYLEEIEGLGGAPQAIEFMQGEIHESAYRHQMEIEANERLVVGVNVFEEEEELPSIEKPDFSSLETAQRLRLEDFKVRRDSGNTSQALEGIRSAARSAENLMPPIIEAAKASATLGEISQVLREEWGAHDL